MSPYHSPIQNIQIATASVPLTLKTMTMTVGTSVCRQYRRLVHRDLMDTGSQPVSATDSPP